ncbi:MAG TPA: hypothetical protein VK760_05370 [Candidatus Acidoferrales bacterium]|jgi:hypothetical protein|nr:hypothetical protein [Candidatus Acidoferrales bacterium]
MSNSGRIHVLAPVGAAIFLLALGVAACSGGHGVVPSSSDRQTAMRNGRTHAAACATGYTGSPSSPLQVVDRSGLTVKTGWPAIYVEVGSQYLTATGALVNNPGTGTVPPIAVSGMCSTFKIPTAANRIFIAYGPGITGNDLNAPNLRTTKILFDWVESGGSGLINPNVNADQFALPIFGSAKDNNGNYYALGFNNKYAAAISAFGASTKPLVVCGAPGGGSPTAPSTTLCPKGQMVLRVLQPYFAVANGESASAFQGFADPFYGTSPTYMSKVGNYYHTSFTKNPGAILFVPYITALPNQGVTTCVSPPGTPPPGGPLACPTYTVDYNSSNAKFTFTLKTGSKTTYPNTVVVGTGKNVHPFTSGDILGNVNLPPLNTSVASQVTFYLQKYLQVDLNRGVAMTAGYHPVLPKCMPHWNSPICYATNFYPKGQTADTYAGILHQYAVQSYVKGQTNGTSWPWTTAEPGGAYGFPYDDTMQQASLVTIPYQNAALPIKAFYLCVQPMVSTAKTACSSTKP